MNYKTENKTEIRELLIDGGAGIFLVKESSDGKTFRNIGIRIGRTYIPLIAVNKIRRAFCLFRDYETKDKSFNSKKGLADEFFVSEYAINKIRGISSEFF